MSNLFGGGSPKTGYGITGGGTGAPWNWGVSPFDQSQIDQATGANTTAMDNRYKQLGLGGSTMQGQDDAGIAQAGEAMTGQLQTQNEANPALNPALQPQLNTIIAGGSNQGSTLSNLAGQVLGKAAGTAGANLLAGA